MAPETPVASISRQRFSRSSGMLPQNPREACQAATTTGLIKAGWRSSSTIKIGVDEWVSEEVSIVLEREESTIIVEG
jgi:hypothetical protein